MESPLSARLPGSWELLSRIDRNARGEQRLEPSLGSDPVAFLVFDRAGHFAAQFMKRDRTTGQVSEGAAVRNNSRAQGGYDAYFGTYTVDEASGMVSTTLTAALSAENVGAVFARHMVVEGEVLTLELDTTTPEGEPVKRTLKWRRVG